MTVEIATRLSGARNDKKRKVARNDRKREVVRNGSISAKAPAMAQVWVKREVGYGG